jgi:hypothetical protein
MIPDEAVEAAAPWITNFLERRGLALRGKESSTLARYVLEAAAPHLAAESDLMRWKLDALREWADAMVSESNYPQYGRDVRTLLNVASVDEARQIDEDSTDGND